MGAMSREVASKEQLGVVGALKRRPLETKSLNFTVDQSRVISHRGSPLVVLGGPATGKTTLLIEAALSRISEGQDPNSILMLTYDRERASELRDAVALRTTSIMHEPIARTFHSLAFSILKMKANPDAADPILMSGAEQEYFIRELIAGDIDLGKNYWPLDLEKALTTHGFARELRDLILRASERNLSPDQLAKLGQESSEKYWQAAAIFWKQYLDILDLQADSAADAKRRIDPSQIVVEAFRHLRVNPILATDLRARFTTILVDEFQESDPAQRALLRELINQDVVICADADSAVGRFRGADPDQLSAELDFYESGKGPNGSRIVLHDEFRSSPDIFEVGAHIASGFAGAAPQRERICARATQGDEYAPVLLGRFRSQSEEAQFIAYQFRHAHLIEKQPWSEMAVILRAPGMQASALRRAFSQSGIPVASEVEALASNPAIAPFLLIAQIALGEVHLNLENCERLLLSEFGGADSVSLRRIRRALLGSRVEADQRTGAQLLIDAVAHGDISMDGAQSLQRIHDLLARARKVLRKSTAQGEDLLWEIWSNAVTSDGSKLSESWRRQALRGGSRGAAADRDLDAMMQLFESARRFAERFPHSKADSFIRQISQESILGDVITAQGQRPDVVQILTVHAAKGREWEVVAIAGLQEGTWPNLRQRGSLLGSERLVEIMRHGVFARKELDALAASGLAEDERRLFYVATTRAKSRLIVTAVAKEDDEPSIFHEEVSLLVNGEEDEREVTQVPRPITPAALVATLRRELLVKSETAASLLKRLAEEGLPEADIDTWAGYLPISSDDPIVPPGQLVSVSPSSAEGFIDCGLKWFLERNGGTNGDSTAQVLGSAIHAYAALMEEDPSLTEEELTTKLRDAWKLIDPTTGWVSATQLNRALLMIEKFVRYHNESLQTRQIIGVEAEFNVVVGRAQIRGSVDRLEVTSSGEIYVVDFKTGASPVSQADALTNMQMQAYQLAVVEGGFDERQPGRATAGAELVYLGSKNKEAPVRRQPPVDATEMRNEIQVIAEGMSGNAFTASINDRCNNCQVRTACPIQSDGRMVME